MAETQQNEDYFKDYRGNNNNNDCEYYVYSSDYDHD